MKKEDEFEKRHQLWHWVALAIGYNHIVLNDAKTLGEKMYFRLMRDAAVERLVGLGGKSPFSKDESPVVLQIELPSGMPHARHGRWLLIEQKGPMGFPNSEKGIEGVLGRECSRILSLMKKHEARR